MNYQASMSRYTPTPPPDYVAAEEALGTIRDTLTVHLDKVWKLALTDDHTVRCTLALPPGFVLLTAHLQQGTMLRHFLSVGLCQMYSAVGRT
jgi:ABC-type oligopeptide transport system substrate-binding subunit